jgi:predicted ATP-grasp superfamily ATP-dependent carboligase
MSNKLKILKSSDHKSNKEPIPALILGMGVHGLAVIRSLGRKGIYVEAACTDNCQPHQYSKYCKKFHHINSLDSFDVIEFLIENGKDKATKQALFITRDKTASIVSKHRERIGKYYYFNLPQHAIVEKLINKVTLPLFLEKTKTLYPKTIHIPLRQLPSIPENLSFPLILKPALRNYHFKAALVYSEEELLSQLNILELGTDVIIQEWVPGTDSDVFFCFVYIDKNGTEKAVFVGKKTRQYPRNFGIACDMIGCENEHVRKESLRLLKMANYRGFGSTEFRRNPQNGKYYFIEFTVGRTDFNVACAIDNGVDIPFIGYSDMVDLEGTHPLPFQNNKVRWVNLEVNLKALKEEYLHGTSSKKDIIKEFLQTLSPFNSFTLFDIDDLKPFIRMTFTLGVRVMRRIGKLVRKIKH